MISTKKLSGREFNKISKMMVTAEEKSVTFMEKDLWKEHMSHIKKEYKNASVFEIFNDNESCGYISVMGDGIIHDICINPQYIGKDESNAIIEEVGKYYDELSMLVYMKNRAAFYLATGLGFTIKAAVLDEVTDEIQYVMKYDTSPVL